MGRLFGTDGVRGVANADLTPELAFEIARAGAVVVTQGIERDRPLIVGRDTRVSGPMLEAAIVAGVTSVGRDVISLGIVPTPAVACVVRAEGAAGGVMISASHNPIADNGIKFFGADGFKLSDSAEREIESCQKSPALPRPVGTDVGSARVAQNLGRHYYEHLYAIGGRLNGLHVVVDAAFGAAYAIVPYALRKLGAEVSELHCENDGSRINVNCGATDVRALQAAVRARLDAGERHVVGVAFDGDADRALFVDETGSAVSGDHVMFAIGTALHDAGELQHNTIVGTVMSNLGFERALAHRGISLQRAAVGDRYVLEAMRAGGFVLGGEQSGHVIDLRHSTTGDGPAVAMALFALLVAGKTRLHDVVAPIVPVPQILVNVRAQRDVLAARAVRSAIRSGEERLARGGRLFVRASGTEPLVRVMAEGDDRSLVEQVAARVAAAIEKEIERRP